MPSKLRRARGALIAAYICAALLDCACDPGVGYSPKGRSEADYRFSQTFDQLDIEMRSLGGLIGDEWLAPEVTFRNRGKSPVKLESVVLKAGGSDYLAGPPSGGGENGWEAVPPGGERRLELTWKFDKPINQILKDPVALRMSIRIGSEEKVIDIPMVKTQG